MTEWLASQLSEGRLWEEPFVKHLNNLSDASIEKLAHAALKPTPEVNADRNRVALFAAMGSGIPARVILKAHLEWVKQHKNEGERAASIEVTCCEPGYRNFHSRPW